MTVQIPHRHGVWAQMPNNKLIFVNIVGTIAAVLSSITLIPQLIEVVSSRNVASLAVGTYAIVIAVSVLWMGYHMMTRTFHGLVSSSFNLVNGTIIFCFIIGIRYLGMDGIDTK